VLSSNRFIWQQNGAFGGAAKKANVISRSWIREKKVCWRSLLPAAAGTGGERERERERRRRGGGRRGCGARRRGALLSSSSVLVVWFACFKTHFKSKEKETAERFLTFFYTKKMKTNLSRAFRS
jgi:hypothetical protein